MMIVKKQFISESDFQSLPEMVKKEGKFCRIIRKQAPVNTKVLALHKQFRVRIGCSK